MKLLFILLIILFFSCQNNTIQNNSPETHTIKYVKDKTGKVIKKIELGCHEVDISCGGGKNTYAVVSEYKDGQVTEYGGSSYFGLDYRIDNSFTYNKIILSEKYYYPCKLEHTIEDSAEFLNHIEKLSKDNQYLFSKTVYEYDSEKLLNKVYAYSKLNSDYISIADTFPNLCDSDYVIPITKNADTYIDSALALREIAIYEYDKENSILQNQYFFREYNGQFIINAYAKYKNEEQKDVFWKKNNGDTLFTSHSNYDIEGKKLSLIPHELMIINKFPFIYKNQSKNMNFKRTVLVKFN
jgi:hypothetical protein